MVLFYQITILFYNWGIYFASLFNPKAKKWVKGRKGIFEKLKSIDNSNVYWFHCASLGELEQGKPVIEKLKENDDRIKILLTFFSPSGYEIGKSYKVTDYVFYLPIDTPKNAKQFIELVNPQKAFFIKYEFWYYYLFNLNEKKIPTYLISGIFRKNQLFFKWYGGFYKKMLSYFTYFFVQNDASKELLNRTDYENVVVTGDTRMDRVYHNSLQPNQPSLIKKFKGKNKVIIAGSSWLKEEKIIAEYIHSSNKDFKFIIAPHDISPNRIKEIEKLLSNNYIKYSEANYDSISSYQTLIIDNIGILANTYQFTDIAFVGGGFTGSLHNILEPASFGNAILFGSKHKKFHEADELLSKNAAFEIKDIDDFIAVINRLLINNHLKEIQQIALNYVKNGIGATGTIYRTLATKK